MCVCVCCVSFAGVCVRVCTLCADIAVLLLLTCCRECHVNTISDTSYFILLPGHLCVMSLLVIAIVGLIVSPLRLVLPLPLAVVVVLVDVVVDSSLRAAVVSRDVLVIMRLCATSQPCVFVVQFRATQSTGRTFGTQA